MLTGEEDKDKRASPDGGEDTEKGMFKKTCTITIVFAASKVQRMHFFSIYPCTVHFFSHRNFMLILITLASVANTAVYISVFYIIAKHGFFLCANM